MILFIFWLFNTYLAHNLNRFHDNIFKRYASVLSRRKHLSLFLLFARYPCTLKLCHSTCVFYSNSLITLIPGYKKMCTVGKTNYTSYIAYLAYCLFSDKSTVWVQQFNHFILDYFKCFAKNQSMVILRKNSLLNFV